jgi:hypothetical protein
MQRIPFRYGFITGALMTMVWIVRKLGWPPLDLFFLLLFVTLVACGGIFAGGVLLAWRHVRGDPRLLRRTAAALLVVSLLPLACYQYQKQRAPSFIAGADSVKGLVLGHNIMGALLITFPADSNRIARMVAPKKHVHERFDSGDSIWVYRQRVPPHRLDVWPPGPDLRVTLTRLLWFWVVGGVLLAGYGPMVKREYGGARKSAGGAR